MNFGFLMFVFLLHKELIMNKSLLKPVIVWGACIAITLVCAGFAGFIQNGCGSVAIETGFFSPEHS